MAKKIAGYIKLQVPAGAANPSPHIGPMIALPGGRVDSSFLLIGICVTMMSPDQPACAPDVWASVDAGHDHAIRQQKPTRPAVKSLLPGLQARKGRTSLTFIWREP